jgi:hypothetical protein
MNASRVARPSVGAPRPPTIRVLAPIALWLLLSIALAANEPSHQGNDRWLEWFFVAGTLAFIVLATSTLSRKLSSNAAWILASLLGCLQGLQTGMAWKTGEASAAASAVAGTVLALTTTVAFGSALIWWHAEGGREWGMAHRRKRAPRWFIIGFIILALVAVFLGALLASFGEP